jgi:Chaperone of endosialidase
MRKGKTMKTRFVKNPIGRSSRNCGRGAFLLVPLVFGCFALLSRAQAVDPPPDGGYPGANTAEGTQSLLGLTSGIWNTALGFQALFTDTTGSFNTATGVRTLYSNTTGYWNTATGVQTLYSNTTGFRNTANGVNALVFNTEGLDNTATGVNALYSNTTGGGNTATGVESLAFNTTGVLNTATGVLALYRNTTGDFNTANGFGALAGNTAGISNTATGTSALLSNTTGNFNTANGVGALNSNTTGSHNIALGRGAGTNVTTADNVIAIGANVSGDNVSNSCYIGSIFSQLSSGGTGVFINSAGKLGTTTSSRRFKDDIKPMDKASEVILALKPVLFHYKKDIDPQGAPQFGLVAEDVENVNPDLVVSDGDGKVNTVRYEAVNAMLLNEFLKEHRTVEELKKELAALTATVKAQGAQIQKVSAQLEASKAAPQTVLNNQ